MSCVRVTETRGTNLMMPKGVVREIQKRDAVRQLQTLGVFTVDVPWRDHLPRVCRSGPCSKLWVAAPQAPTVIPASSQIPEQRYTGWTDIAGAVSQSDHFILTRCWLRPSPCNWQLTKHRSYWGLCMELPFFLTLSEMCTGHGQHKITGQKMKLYKHKGRLS